MTSALCFFDLSVTCFTALEVYGICLESFREVFGDIFETSSGVFQIVLGSSFDAFGQFLEAKQM